MASRFFLASSAALLLAGCAATPKPQAAPPPPAPRSFSNLGLESVMGANAATLGRLFGKFELDVREGDARKLQFAGPACVLDTYLYPPRAGGEPVVTWVDARLLDGRDIDRASCVAALGAKQQVR